jgi:hypothetical protein
LEVALADTSKLELWKTDDAKADLLDIRRVAQPYNCAWRYNRVSAVRHSAKVEI